MTKREIYEHLLRTAKTISSNRRRISNEKDTHKAVDCAINALDYAYESVISIALAVQPCWTGEWLQDNKEDEA